MTIDRKRLVDVFRAELEATHDPEAALAAVAVDAISRFQEEQKDELEDPSYQEWVRSRRGTTVSSDQRIKTAVCAAHQPTREITMLEVAVKKILWEVASDYSIPPDRLFDRRWGHRRFAAPRWVAICMLRDIGLSTTKIAKIVGLADHTTVIYALRALDSKRSDLRARANKLWSLLDAQQDIHVPTGSFKSKPAPTNLRTIGRNKEAA